MLLQGHLLQEALLLHHFPKQSTPAPHSCITSALLHPVSSVVCEMTSCYKVFPCTRKGATRGGDALALLSVPSAEDRAWQRQLLAGKHLRQAGHQQGGGGGSSHREEPRLPTGPRRTLQGQGRGSGNKKTTCGENGPYPQPQLNLIS